VKIRWDRQLMSASSRHGACEDIILGRKATPEFKPDGLRGEEGSRGKRQRERRGQVVDGALGWRVVPGVAS